MPSRVDPQQPPEDAHSSMLAKLRQPQFDPVDFLNEALPPLNLSSQAASAKTSRSAQIQSAATDSLSFLSSLNTTNVRASSELTSLTDEIIRSGNRLAYEVEVLRGDANGLHELLTESLRDDIGQFVQDEATGQAAASTSATLTHEPDFMVRLRLLGTVKARLEAVVSIFGEAMKWPVPPSELSMASSLISVSSPELGMQSTAEDDKAHEVLKGIRAEITDLLQADPGNYEGLEAAARRVEEYRQLALLWKGTAEERTRVRFVDTLAKVVEDRRKAMDARGLARGAKGDGSTRSSSATGRNTRGANEPGGAAGLFRNLQRFKDDLYLE